MIAGATITQSPHYFQKGLVFSTDVFLSSVIFQGLGHSHFCCTHDKDKGAKGKTLCSFFLFLVNSAFVVPSCHVRAEGNTEFSESKSHVQGVWPERVICSQMEAAFPGSSGPSTLRTDVTRGQVPTGRAEPLRVLTRSAECPGFSCCQPSILHSTKAHKLPRKARESTH